MTSAANSNRKTNPHFLKPVKTIASNPMTVAEKPTMLFRSYDFSNACDLPEDLHDSVNPAQTIAATHHSAAMLRAIGKGMGHRHYMISAEADGQVVGLLPLVLMTSPFFGRHLVSLPYVNWAGAVAKDNEIASRMVDEAIAMADDMNVRHLELRHEYAVDHPKLKSLQTNKVQMRVDLPETEEEAWKMIRSSVRSQVRKGDKQGFRIEFGGEPLLEDFYQVFSVNMRDLGTPVFARTLFREFLGQLGDQAELCVVYLDDKPIACSLVWYIGELTQVPSASALKDYRSTAVNTWMYWQIMRRAVAKKSSIFDFGRSTDGGPTFDFKRKWGCQPQPAAWQYYVRRGDPTQMRPDSSRFSMAIRVWRRLPVWLTRLVGPSIVKGIP